LFLLLLALPFLSHAQTKALVGGTLTDGYGGKPLQNSVIIIEGERIKAIGTVGNIEIPKNAEVISTEGMSDSPALLHQRWPRTRVTRGLHKKLNPKSYRH
jgi:imidazolonepropionase-like amidohydrolase